MWVSKRVDDISLSFESAVSTSFQENKGRPEDTGNAGREQTELDLNLIYL